MLKMNRCILSVQMKNMLVLFALCIFTKYENPRGFGV